jgi:hypothetical protein
MFLSFSIEHFAVGCQDESFVKLQIRRKVINWHDN